MDNAQPEPSMEEILASIRRIISEDDEEGAPQRSTSTPHGAAPASAKTPPAPSGRAPSDAEARGAGSETRPAPSKPQPVRDDDGARPHLETEDVEMIKKNVARATEDHMEEAILDDSAANAASSAFDNLSQSMRITDEPGRTLEDIVVEMLKPLVKEWLNANLPAIVEEKVEEEVQRVARRRR